jgi:glycosyltransferase involved in cell wall biosynthesis
VSDRPVRVVAVLPEPTPYRTPLFDLLAARPELDFHAVYAADAIAGNRWSIEVGHPHTILRGVRVPGAAAVLRHDYPVTPGVFRALRRLKPQCLVVTGWSTFTSQAAMVWAAARGVPVVLQVESHDAGPRSGWRKAVKGAVVPRIVRRASGVLVTGTLARESMLARGARPETIGVFANTTDVERFALEAGRRRERRVELRSQFGLGEADVAVLSVARLAREKGVDTLLHAAALAGSSNLRVVLAGAGPEQTSLERLAVKLGVRTSFRGPVDRDALLDLYVACDAFALLSRHEPWAVVVNEAAACGLPLLLSDRVGAARDLLRTGTNGIVVPADDAGAAATALRSLIDDPDFRVRAGAASQEIVADWGYGPSVEAFVEAVQAAVADSLGP